MYKWVQFLGAYVGIEPNPSKWEIWKAQSGLKIGESAQVSELNVIATSF
jgi:hypothetical protein